VAHKLIKINVRDDNERYYEHVPNGEKTRSELLVPNAFFNRSSRPGRVLFPDKKLIKIEKQSMDSKSYKLP